MRLNRLVMVILCILALLCCLSSTVFAEHVDTMVHTAFYGYIPIPPAKSGGPKAISIIVVGLQDSTKVSIYDIGGRQLLVERTINRFEVLEYNVTKELYFKIVTNKPVAAAVTGMDPRIGQSQVAPTAPGTTLTTGWFAGWGYGMTHYPSVTGSPIGNEFIIYALYPQSKIYSLETSKISVYDARGVLIDSFTMPAYWVTDLLLSRREVYHIVSTGKIMVVIEANDAVTALPDVNTGNLVGTKFIGRPTLSRGRSFPNDILLPNGSYVIYAYENVVVDVYDLLGQKVLYTHTIAKGEYFYKNDVPAIPLMFVSSGLISVWIGSCRQTDGVYSYSIHISALGDDVWFAGGVNGREFMFFAPSYAILFAPQDVRVNIDGSERSLKADEYVRISSGFHKVTSDKTVIIQIVGLGEALDSWAQYLVSSPEVPASHPELSGGGPDITLIAGGGAVAAIAAIVAVMIIKRRK